jgi:hypothetical protein
MHNYQRRAMQDQQKAARSIDDEQELQDLSVGLKSYNQFVRIDHHHFQLLVT